MRLEEIKVGDILRVREWGDMTHEFVLDDDGDIRINPGEYFFLDMADACGKQFIVASIDGDIIIPTDYTLRIFDGSTYDYTAAMLEREIFEEIEDFDNVEEILFCGG